MAGKKELANVEPNNAMTLFAQKMDEIWSDEKQIQRLFAEKLSDAEFQFFIALGKNLGANPFMREIWAVKYGNSPAQIFLGRDFYRRKAEENSAYENHLVESIYSNDHFKVVNGIVSHEYNLAERGRLLGAYCLVWRKGFPNPFYHRVSFDEYNLKQSLWTAKPETMIKKVAEAQGLRGAFQGTFRGTYDESEQWEAEKTNDYEVLPDKPETYVNPVTGSRRKDESPVGTLKMVRGQKYRKTGIDQWELVEDDPETDSFEPMEEGDKSMLDMANEAAKQREAVEGAANGNSNGGAWF